MHQSGEKDLPVTIQQAGRARLSGGEPFDIMAHHVVQESDSIRSPNGENGSGKFWKEPTGAANRLNGLVQGRIHGVDYITMAASSFDPQRIERFGDSGLKVLWGDGHESLYPWTLLRTWCPCAMCRQAERIQSDPSIRPLELQPVGRYAMAIRWSDGHSTGIFSHEYLRSLCPCESCQPKDLTEG